MRIIVPCCEAGFSYWEISPLSNWVKCFFSDAMCFEDFFIMPVNFIVFDKHFAKFVARWETFVENSKKLFIVGWTMKYISKVSIIFSLLLISQFLPYIHSWQDVAYNMVSLNKYIDNHLSMDRGKLYEYKWWMVWLDLNLICFFVWFSIRSVRTVI